MKLTYQLRTFSELSLNELYDILRLRQEVFIVEQNCPYLDADGKDQEAHHVLGFDESRILQAYTRILAKGASYEHYCSIGRVITSEQARGKRLGYPLMEASINFCQKLYPETSIKISAQAHLENFYSKLGFIPTGEKYLEDDIPHIGMTLAYSRL